MSTTTASFLVGVTTGMTTALRSLAAMNQTEMSGQMNISDTEEEKRKLFESYILTKVTFSMSLYNLWVILALGLPGNVASIFTIMSMPVVSSSKAHVAILAVTDSLAIIMKVAYLELSGSAVQVTVPVHALIMFINEFCSVYANWVVVAMTAERVLAVCFPLRVGRMYTRRKALIVLACLAVATASVYLFHFWAWAEHYEPGFGHWYELKQEYQDFLTGAFYYISGCLYVLLPCVFVLAGNALIIINIKRARRAQRHLTNAFDQGGRTARDQRQITVMLIAVSVVFLMLNIPNAIIYFAKNSWKYELLSYDHAKYNFTIRFIHMLSDANHAVNFYLYFLSMSTFRRRFLDAIRCRGRTRRRPAGSSVYRTSQTYLHSLQQTGDTVRPDGTGYSAFKRSSNHVDSSHSLRSYGGGGSNNNKLFKSSSSAHEGQNCITASSNV